MTGGKYYLYNSENPKTKFNTVSWDLYIHIFKTVSNLGSESFTRKYF